MRRKVYHSLDRPSSLLGIEGRYITLVLSGALPALFVSVAVSAFTDIQTAVLCFVLVMVAVYMLAMRIQSRIPQKQFWKVILSPLLPGVYRVAPGAVRNAWRGLGIPSSPESRPRP